MVQPAPAMFISLLFLTPVIAAMSLQNSEKNVCFAATTREGLPFPLPDPMDLSISVGHGVHCLEALESDTHQAGPVYEMHKVHCRQILQSILDFLIQKPDYSASKMACRDLINDASDKAVVRFVGSYCPSCGTNKTNAYDERYEESLLAKLITTPSGTTDPDKFWQLAGFNLGKLLMRQHFHPETLSVAERNYLAQWDSPFNTRMSALGVACLQGNPIERIQKILA